jgi:hypothetical protein
MHLRVVYALFTHFLIIVSFIIYCTALLLIFNVRKKKSEGQENQKLAEFEIKRPGSGPVRGNDAKFQELPLRGRGRPGWPECSSVGC